MNGLIFLNSSGQATGTKDGLDWLGLDCINWNGLQIHGS